MPDLNNFRQNTGQLHTINEEKQMNDPGDVRYKHYINNQNEKVNTMTIQRPETSAVRAETSRPESQYQNN